MERKTSSLSDPLLEQSSSSSEQIIEEYDFIGEEEIKEKLQWYFKTPYQKYSEKGRKPIKLILQVLKIFLITFQAIVFATEQSSVVRYTDENLETFRHIFIQDYDGTKVRKLYTKQDVYNHMFHVWKKYYDFEDSMIGSYKTVHQNDTTKPIYFCKEWYQLNDHIRLPQHIGFENKHAGCYSLKKPKTFSNKTTLQEFVQQNHLPQTIVMILSLKMSFTLETNYSVFHSNRPDCYKFHLTVDFENYDLDGTIRESLDTYVDYNVCHKNEKAKAKPHQLVISFMVIVICMTSFVLCLRSFKNHRQLYKDAKHFFKDYRYEDFNISDKLVFFSFWLVLIVLSDIFSTAGSIILLLISWLEYPQLYWLCSILFGLAVLFSWSGVLRYLGFIKGYNVLLVTLRVSFPPIMRFISCAVFIYLGFVLCGWIVLGPYHVKFANLFTACECLYSLLNGDDMYNTFQLIDNATPLIYYFSKVYLYVFISLFIFVALSLFIGIVEESFEKINESGNAPKTRVQLFMEGNEYNEDGASDDAGDE